MGLPRIEKAGVPQLASGEALTALPGSSAGCIHWGSIRVSPVPKDLIFTVVETNKRNRKLSHLSHTLEKSPSQKGSPPTFSLLFPTADQPGWAILRSTNQGPKTLMHCESRGRAMIPAPWRNVGTPGQLDSPGARACLDEALPSRGLRPSFFRATRDRTGARPWRLKQVQARSTKPCGASCVGSPQTRTDRNGKK